MCRSSLASIDIGFFIFENWVTRRRFRFRFIDILQQTVFGYSTMPNQATIPAPKPSPSSSLPCFPLQCLAVEKKVKLPLLLPLSSLQLHSSRPVPRPTPSLPQVFASVRVEFKNLVEFHFRCRQLRMRNYPSEISYGFNTSCTCIGGTCIAYGVVLTYFQVPPARVLTLCSLFSSPYIDELKIITINWLVIYEFEFTQLKHVIYFQHTIIFIISWCVGWTCCSPNNKQIS